MAPMRALRNLFTPPTSPSPSNPRPPPPPDSSSDYESSILTDEISIDFPDSSSIPDAPDPNPPSMQAAAGEGERERGRPLSCGSADLRSADDLLTQFDVLRDSAHAARARRHRFRGDDGEDGEPEPSNENEFMMRDHIDAVHQDRASESPLSNAETLAPSDPSYLVKTRICKEGNSFSLSGDENHLEASQPARSDVHYLPALPVGLGPGRGYSNTNTNALTASGEKRCRGKAKARGKCIGGPMMALVRRILCLGPLHDTEPVFVASFHHPISISAPIQRAPSPGPSMSNSMHCSTFESLLAIDSNTTRRLCVRPHSSIASPTIVDIH